MGHGKMEKASSWSVLSGVPASLVMASVPLPSPYPSSQGTSWGSRGYLKGFIRAHMWAPGTSFACTPPPRMDIRTPASLTLITVICQCGTLLRPHLKSASEEAMMGADGDGWTWGQERWKNASTVRALCKSNWSLIEAGCTEALNRHCRSFQRDELLC